MKTVLISVLICITSGFVVAQDNLTASTGIEKERPEMNQEQTSEEPMIKIVTVDKNVANANKTEPVLSVARVVINDSGDMVEVTEFEANKSMSKLPATKYTVDVFPTPAEGLVNIQLREKKLFDGNVKVYDMFGHLVEHMLFKGSYVSMEFNEKKPGTYMMHLEAGNGSVKGTYKVVKSE